VIHWTLQVTFLLVFWACIGGLWRPTALALIGAWAIGQAVYLTTGNSLPIALYLATDAMVLITIWARYGSKYDAAIMVLFVPCWYAYYDLTGSNQWWLLWWISSAQLLLAGPLPQLQKIIFSISHGPIKRANT
jgi:hypothetical protein